MAKWNPFSSVFWFEPGWEESQFKRVPEGWLMPGTWPFSKSYLLSDEQKAVLITCTRSAFDAFWGRASVAMTLMCAMSILFFVVVLTSFPNLTLVLVVSGGFLTSICVLFGVETWAAINYWRTIRAALAGLAQTPQKFSWTERFKMNAMVMSRNFWVFLVIVSIVIAVPLCRMIASELGLRQFNFVDLLLAGELSSSLILGVVMLIAKSRMTRGQPSS